MLSNCSAGEDSRVPWTARRSTQSILKQIYPEYSLEGLMLKLKLQYFGYLMWRTDSLEKTLMLGKTEGKRKGWQRMWWLDSNTGLMDMNLRKLRERVKDGGTWCVQSMGSQIVRHDLATEQRQLARTLSYTQRLKSQPESHSLNSCLL